MYVVMFLYKPAFLFVVCTILLVPVSTHVIVDASTQIITNLTLEEDLKTEENRLSENIIGASETSDEKVKIQLYYECFCPYCRDFDTDSFAPTVEKLASYLDVYVYPYGHAKTTTVNGTYHFTCQHGPGECYGNKLHACAIDYLGNIIKSISFNSCMMDKARENKGSDDEAADACGQQMSVDSKLIKECAKGNKGSELLALYGKETKKIKLPYVPYTLINGKVITDRKNFMHEVCAAFVNPPSPCRDL